MNSIGDYYGILFDFHDSNDAIVHVYASTQQEITSILSILYVGLSYKNDAAMNSWEYKEGFIDGNEYMFDKKNQTLPIGLIPRATKYLKERKPTLKISVSDEIRNIYTSPIKVNREMLEKFANYCNIYNKADDFKITPFDHQFRLVEKALNGRRISMMACTSAGKSLSIYLLVRWLIEKENKKVLVITPSSSLVVQLYDNFEVDYGWSDATNKMTLIYGDSKDKITVKQQKQLHELQLGEEVLFKDIVVSTWQSLQTKLPKPCESCTKLKRPLCNCKECNSIKERSEKFFSVFDAVIVDEAHSARGPVLRDILSSCSKATNFKIGLSGTLPDDGLDAAWIEGCLGRKEEIVRLKELVSLGILTPLEVYSIKIPYVQSLRPFICSQQFQSEYSLLTNNESRKEVMKLLINSGQIDVTQNTVMLYKSKATLAEMHEYLTTNYPQFKYRIIQGDVSTTERELIRKEMENSVGNFIIATYGTMKQGVNIKLLHNLVFAEFSKSMYEIVQSLGRIVRAHPTKKIARAFDIYDDCHYYTKSRYPKLKENYSLKHYSVRKGYYQKDDIPIHELSLEGIYEAYIDSEAVQQKKLALKEKNNKTSTKKVEKIVGKKNNSQFLK